MKLTTVCSLALAFSLHAGNTNSQTVKVTVKQNNTELSSVLNDIEKQTDYLFVYDKYVNVNRKVSVNSNKKPLEEVLNQLFGETDVKFTVDGTYIILSAKEKTAEIVSPINIQQGKNITGIVKDANGEPIIGANVVEKGTTNGTITDMEGRFSLNVASNATLIVSYIGYASTEVAVKEQSSVNVILKEDSEALEEVVVVGYGTQKKSTLTGAVSSVKSEQLTVSPVGNVTNSLTGKLPGLITKQTSGLPGSDAAKLSIRGFGDALVIVDGVEGSMSNLDANQIENVTILKDGAASIYGARAGNGVILVTTKRGVNQKPTITVNASYTMQGVTNLAKKASSGEWTQMLREEHLQSGKPEESAPFTADAVAKYFAGNDPAYPSFDWYDTVFRKWAPQHNENVSIRGGSEKIKYYGLFGYQNQQTMVRKNGGDYSRYNLQSNIDAYITDRLKLSIDLSAIYDKGKFTGRGLSGAGSVWQDYYNTQPWYMPAFSDPSKNPYGGIDIGSVALSSNMDIWGYSLTKNKDLRGTATLEYDFPFIEGLKIKGTVSYMDWESYGKNFSKPYKFYTYNQAADLYTLAGERGGQAQLSESVKFNRQLTQQYSLNYDRTFNAVHHITALALFESIDQSGNDFWASREKFMTSAIDQLYAGSDEGKNNSGSAYEMGRMSFVGRVNYSYADKYLVDFILRADASANFPKGDRWGYFPSISVGWVLSKENFMAQCSSVDQLKLRLSYGSSGYDYKQTSDIRNYQYLAGYNIGGVYQWGDGFVKGLSPTSLANPLITWEEMKIYNAGVDFSFFNRAIYGSFEGFYRDRSGILATRAKSLPGTFGASSPLENINSSNDRGFELSLGTSNSKGDFSYDISANLSWARAKWDHYEETNYSDPDQIRINKKSGYWTDREFGYVSDGLFTSQEEINALPYSYAELGGNNATLRPGDVKYKDINNDGVLDWRDQKEIGKGDTPHWFYGLSGFFSYRNFDLEAVFQGAAGYSAKVNGNMKTKRTYDVRWTEASNDPNALEPRLGGASSNGWASDYWLKSVAYLRLKNIALGYTIPKKLTEAANIERLRLYISATNLFTLSSVSEYNIDPEVPSGSADQYYPQQRTISFGVNLSF
ncbi:TonB-dependent receptor [uncultured Parabacteroides sp.]|uniref:TonB-dependent receptor n=1 Tax=uncultured Parabacteroides sp. TaxID=512312 RepID=UPI00259AEEF2|nr:TonB-dependent receptor [uncultured Parabacteroides sp.]